jgi:gluconate kinase
MTQQNVDMKFVIVSFDVIRYELSWSANDINNEIAFQKLLERIDALNKNNKNIIIDCGLVADKLYRLEKLINNKPLIKVFLDGDYNILKNRVMQRDRDK